MRIDAVYALPDYQYEEQLELAEGATVADALAALAACEGFSALDLGSVPVGVFGLQVSHSYVLEASDRVEIYRPLQVDPMTSRRLRAQRQDR